VAEGEGGGDSQDGCAGLVIDEPPATGYYT
jgi:hypothetical protein